MYFFSEEAEKYSWDKIKEEIYAKKAEDVERALTKPMRDLSDFMALISPAASAYLEEMGQLSHALTRKRFGKTIQLYAPMYLSNECQNICTYCGFSVENGIKRITLTDNQILKEAQYLRGLGYQHILLVTGEANRTVGVPYFEKALSLLKPYFSHISIEVQPLETEEYRRLVVAGLNTVLVYQETYHPDNYRKHHPKGKKSNYEYRLNTPDRLGQAGVHKIGLGALLGLEDWRTDSFYCALHLQYLEKKYWKTKYSISFPRLRKCEGHENIHSDMTDRELVQLICAYRILNEEIELSISTRERQSFRDNIINLGITAMSAGSKTNPGGYTQMEDSLEQFEISDERSVGKIVEMLHTKGIEPIWKDWDKVYW